MKMMCKELDIIYDKLNNQQNVDCNYNNNPKKQMLMRKKSFFLFSLFD